MTAPPTSPEQQREADATRVAGVLLGRTLVDDGALWRLPFDFVRPGCMRPEFVASCFDELEANLESFAGLNACDPGWTLQPGRHLRRLGLCVPPPHAAPGE